VRLWSIDPVYLDPKGLVALWREGLLALQVLRGNTKGYTNHPQLARFREQKDPIKTLECYLQYVYLEAQRRGYHFNHRKIHASGKCQQIAVTDGQLLNLA
jgi:hypothetical protein